SIRRCLRDRLGRRYPWAFPRLRCDETGFAFTIRGLMLQGTPGRRVSEFYDHHPISEAGVLAALARRGRTIPDGLTVDDLFELDQDHYGGLAAVDALARRAGVDATSRVLDGWPGRASATGSESGSGNGWRRRRSRRSRAIEC